MAPRERPQGALCQGQRVPLSRAAAEDPLSCYAILLAEDLCMGTQPWEAYTVERKASIREAWLSNNRIPNESFGEVITAAISNGELRGINLFG